ncbi:MAG: Crp/Fnr family transcriptional regulator [Myxococcales bacterium]|nr:Crp/Fnr family transcriptional regulator [Myxococcales bacterium]
MDQFTIEYFPSDHVGEDELSRENSETLHHHFGGDVANETKKLLEPYLSRKHFKAGQLLWREGETDGMLVALESGSVKIYRLLPDGKTVTLYIFGPGTVFGFMPFLDGGPYPAYAQALEDSEAQVMPRSLLLGVMKKDPDVAVVLLQHLARRLRGAFDQIERMSSKGTLPKVAAALASLLPDSDFSMGTTVIILPQSSREFAALIGITPESFSRNITDLVRKNILHRLGANRFQVLDPDALRQTASAILL